LTVTSKELSMGKIGSSALFFLCSLVTGSAQAGSAACQAQSGPQTGALLELYTSEGCSSCPPADRWLGNLALSADPKRLSLLGFHVDYWDDIGWPDRFASHAYTQRQTARVHTGGSTTIYTPQVMLGSRLDQRWYKPDDVVAAIRSEQSRPSAVSLSISASPQAADVLATIKAAPLVSVANSAQLYLAIYQDKLSSSVKAGENNGVTLHHDRVVRGLWGPWALAKDGATRSLRITPPKGAALAQLGLTAFVQDTHTGETLQALTLPLTACAAP
jgi:hypothetical protein